MSSEATGRLTPTDENASVADYLREQTIRTGVLLGTDAEGRQHIVWPSRGEITISEWDGCERVHLRRYDLAGRTRDDYRVFVETETDAEMDWNEEAF